MVNAEKVRENRLRDWARRQGYTLHKSRARHPRAKDYGTYRLLPAEGNAKGRPRDFPDIDAVEKFLSR